MKILLYPHTGSGNHGCEALVRSTAKVLGLCNKDLFLFSKRPSEESDYSVNKICNVLQSEVSYTRNSLSFFKAYIKYHLSGDLLAFEELTYKNLLQEIPNLSCALSFGGDNYCYSKPTYIYIMNKILRKYDVPTILWGCSVEKNLIDAEMKLDLNRYEKIVARESISYDILREIGFKNIFLLPDPAFQLDRVDLSLPEEFVEGNTVGINVSPMIIGYEKNQGMTLQNYKVLIQYIIDHTDMQVALIPHVVWKDNDDRIPLKILYDSFKETGRICMIADHNAEELKGFIARCRFMVAARTHASIAAYSQEVPTLVVGYSVKARGIAKDLFGSDEGYVVPVQSLNQEDNLKTAFLSLLKNEDEIRGHMNSFMPEYKERVWQLKSIIGK